jgi:hypothetical protein
MRRPPSFITRQNIVYVPLWFAEGGRVELDRLGAERGHAMRDGASRTSAPDPVRRRVPGLQAREAAMKLTERYGGERIRDCCRSCASTATRPCVRARSGTTVAKFDQDFHSWLKKTYWPSVTTKSGPGQFARRLPITGAPLEHQYGRRGLSARRPHHLRPPPGPDIYVLSTLAARCSNA